MLFWWSFGTGLMVVKSNPKQNCNLDFILGIGVSSFYAAYLSLAFSQFHRGAWVDCRDLFLHLTYIMGYN